MQFVVRKSVEINAPPSKIWRAITDPKITKHWVMGLEVSSDWKQGSPITWKGVSNGKEIIHKGHILRIKREKLLQVSDFGLETGLEDIEANYTRITYDLREGPSMTILTVTEDKFNGDEKRYRDADDFWSRVLPGIKTIVEK